MTDISIIGTGCLIVALVIAAGIVVRLRNANRALANAEIRRKATLRAHLIKIGKKGRATQTARALAKKAAGQ